MLKHLRHLFAIMLVCLLCVTTASVAHSEQINFITEKLPPLSYEKDGELTGYNIELIKKVWERMERPPTQIRTQPWPRSIRDLESSTPTCLFPVALTPERRKAYRHVESPALFEAVLITHKADAHNFKTEEQIKNAKICAPTAVSFLDLLKKQGFAEKNNDYSTTLVSTISKFMKKRAPLLGGDRINILYNYQKLGGNPADLQVVWHVATVSNGFIFNDAVSDEFIEEFRRKMEDVRYSTEHIALYNEWLRFNIPKN